LYLFDARRKIKEGAIRVKGFEYRNTESGSR